MKERGRKRGEEEAQQLARGGRERYGVVKKGGESAGYEGG